MKYWLVKTEPETYSWDDLSKKEEDLWDGVRNYQARNFMKEMNLGDHVMFYHSGKDKAVVGVAEITKEQYPDPNQGEDDRWVSVNMKAIKKLPSPVTLEQIKKKEELANMLLIKQSRLSVMPLSSSEFETILLMSSL